MTRLSSLNPRLRILGSPHTDLVGNSSSLVLTHAINAGVGFLFWLVAARAFSADAVGTSAAAVSAMNLVGTVSMFGMGTLLIAELSTSPRGQAARLINSAMSIAVSVAMVGGAAYSLWIQPAVGHQPGTEMSPVAHGLLILATVLTTATLILDEAAIGLLVGHVQLLRNTVFAVTKLAVLACVGLALPRLGAEGILGAWCVGILASLVVVTLRLRTHGVSLLARPDFGLARRLCTASLDHNLVNVALLVPRAGLPVLVAVMFSPAVNAAFYVAFMIVGLLSTIPAALTMSLFAVAGASPAELRAKTRLSVQLSVVVGIPCVAAILLLRVPTLALFGPQYAETAANALAILALAYLPSIIGYHYIAVSRIAGRLRRAGLVACAAAVLELGAATLGGHLGSLDGLALGVALATTLEAMVMAPAVLRVLRPAGPTAAA